MNDGRFAKKMRCQKTSALRAIASGRHLRARSGHDTVIGSPPSSIANDGFWLLADVMRWSSARPLSRDKGAGLSWRGACIILGPFDAQNYQTNHHLPRLVHSLREAAAKAADLSKEFFYTLPVGSLSAKTRGTYDRRRQSSKNLLTITSICGPGPRPPRGLDHASGQGVANTTGLVGVVTRNCLSERSGGVMVLTAVMIFGILACSALVIDLGYAYVTQTQLQNTADSAALAAARELPNQSAVETAAIQYANKNMATGQHGNVITASNVTTGNWNPSTRTFDPSGTPVNAVTVVASRSQANGNPLQTFFAKLINVTGFDISARAMVFYDGLPNCMLALDNSAAMALDVTGGAALTTSNCAIHVNSSDGTALRTSGAGSQITADSVCVNGNYSAGGNGITQTPNTGCGQKIDPLASYLTPPDASSCDYNNATYTGSGGGGAPLHTLDPGVYCGGITVKGGASVELNPGTYVMKDGKLKVTGGGDVTGNGVTVYLEGNNAEIDLGGGGNLHMTAPASGPLAGMLIYGDNTASPGLSTSNLSGGGNLYYEGVIYLPTQLANFSGGSVVNTPPLSVVIADEINFSGGSSFTFQADLDNTTIPLPPPLMPRAKIVD